MRARFIPAQSYDIRVGWTMPTDHAMVDLCLLEILSAVCNVVQQMVPSWNLAEWLGTIVINNAHDGADVTTVHGNQNRLLHCRRLYVGRRYRWRMNPTLAGGRTKLVKEYVLWSAPLHIAVIGGCAVPRLRQSSLSWRFTSWFDVGPHPNVWYTASDGFPRIRSRAATLEWMQSFCFFNGGCVPRF